MDTARWVSGLGQLGMDYGSRLLVALLILLLGYYGVRLLARLAERALVRRQVDLTVSRFLGNLAYAAGFVVVVIAVLGQLGVQTASLVAVIGAAGLAVGLALQGSLSNFAAGVLMVMLRPCKVGDFIEGAGAAGIVHEISLFTTTIKTGDNKTVIIPNADLLNGNITNYTREDKRRIDLVIGVGYGADTAAVKQVLREAVEADARVLQDMGVEIAVRELAASSVNYIVRPWVRTADYWAVHGALLEAIKQRLEDQGMAIPFPQVDVHVRRTNQ